MENSSQKVLIFTYYWPPASGPGVQRFLKFAKYFPENGWEPIVIAPKNGSYPYYDETLLNDIPSNVEIHHTKTLEPFTLYNFLRGAKGKSVPVAMTGIKDSSSPLQKISKYIRANYFIPDARIGWNKYAIKKANEIISNTEINAIITTGPPQSTHLIGLHLTKIHNLPWIADFRDPWTTVYYNKFLPRTESSKRKDKNLENTILQNADIVTTVSPGIKKEFEDRAKRAEVIYNGFDENDIYSGELTPTTKFKLAYIGNYKPNQDVEALWQAIKELKEEMSDFDRNFNLSFTGIVDPNIINKINDLGLADL
ncbi:glycosyltransferase, partial [Cytophagaceae bacterium AH-315-L13]|nr:glycosyltransferase [Cytophagaceae bacterium AH-315-L13]